MYRCINMDVQFNDERERERERMRSVYKYLSIKDVVLYVDLVYFDIT